MTLVLIGTTACVAMAGCTTTSQGQPLPQPTGSSETTTADSSSASPPSTSSSNGDLPSDGAPKVKNPLDTSRFQQSPCQVLTAAQLQELKLPARGEQRQGPLGLACNWLNPETGGSAEIQWANRNPRGLSATYAAHKAGKYAYFIELSDVEGFPAVAADLSDRRDIGSCIVTGGVADQLIFQVSVQLSLRNIGQKDPCNDGAVLVAGMMLRTMKAG